MAKRPSIKNCKADQLMALAGALHYPGDRDATRRALVFAAGVVNNTKLLKDLGSQESSGWYEGRRAADPEFSNPYWPDKR